MIGVTTLLALVNMLAKGLEGLLAGAELVLYTNTFVPLNNTPYATLVQPTGMTGYVAKVITWTTPGWDNGQQQAVAVGTTVSTWAGPADATGVVITGWALLQPGAVGPPIIPETLLAAGNFPLPINLLSPLDDISLTVSVTNSGIVTVQQLS